MSLGRWIEKVQYGIIGVSERDGVNWRLELFMETVAMNVTEPKRDTSPQLREAHFILSRISAKKPTTRHILMKMQNIKEKTLKVVREKR